MDIHEYQKTVRDQINTVTIRDAIEKELAGHLEDQQAAFIEDGMTKAEAEEAAVKEMGDPIQVGLSLNEIHKPKPAQRYICAYLVLNLILLGFNIREIISNQGLKDTGGAIASFFFAFIPCIANQNKFLITY